MIEKGFKVILILNDLILLFAFGLAFAQAQFGFSFHIASAGVAILLSFFANSCALFYFIGSGVWLRDEAKALVIKNRAAAMQVWELYEKANKLKGKAFPLPSLNIALALFTFILGGASQVGASALWIHILLASLFVVCSLLSTRILFKCIKTNLELLDQATGIIEAN